MRRVFREVRPMSLEEEVDQYYEVRGAASSRRGTPEWGAALERTARERVAGDVEAAARWDAFWEAVLAEQPELRTGPPKSNPYRR